MKSTVRRVHAFPSWIFKIRISWLLRLVENRKPPLTLLCGVNSVGVGERAQCQISDILCSAIEVQQFNSAATN